MLICGSSGQGGEGEAEAEVARVTQARLWSGTCMDAHTLYLHTHTAMETPIWIHGRKKAVWGHASGCSGACMSGQQGRVK